MSLGGWAWAGLDNTNQPLRLELELVDGSRIIGTPGINAVPLQTTYAKMDIPLKQILTLRIDANHETASLDLQNGDKLNGIVNLEPIGLETVFGKVTVGIECIKELRVASRWPEVPGLTKCFDFDAQPDLAFYNATGQPDQSVISISGGLMEQRTFSVNESAGFTYPNASQTGGGLFPANATILEARINVLRINGSAGVFFQAFDGAYRYSVFLTPTGIDIPSSSGNDHVPLDVFGFHTYRLETPGNSPKIRLYYDGKLVHVATAPDNTTLNGFGFGDGHSPPGNGGDATWDYVLFCQRPPLPAHAVTTAPQ
jgi:hypothetical protein